MTPTSQAAKLPTTKSASARVAAELLAVLAAHDVRELLCQAVERGAQAKADATPPRCPACGQPLSRRSCGHARTFECRFGSLTVQRARGHCQHCQKWRTPADASLGLAATAGVGGSHPNAGTGFTPAPASGSITAARARAGAPIGSGPVEATCRQYQCRFKRPGQFWSQRGDEALMCLETFWRNDRWRVYFYEWLIGEIHAEEPGARRPARYRRRQKTKVSAMS